MDKEYRHLITFSIDGFKLFQKVMTTKDSIPTLREWNMFTDSLEELKGADWVVVNSFTTFRDY